MTPLPPYCYGQANYPFLQSEEEMPKMEVEKIEDQKIEIDQNDTT